jgi:hypothetical protein
LRFVAGLQAIFVTVIGWNIFFRHLGNRIEKITASARRLNAPFQEEAFRRRLKQIEESLAKKGTHTVQAILGLDDPYNHAA